MELLIELSYVILLILMNAFFVAAEFSLVKIRKSRIETLIADGNNAAHKTKRILDDLNLYLPVCQLGVTLASLGLGWVAEPAVTIILSPLMELTKLPAGTTRIISVVLGFSLITAFEIVLGELVPKSLSIVYTEKIAIAVSTPIILFYKLAYPIVWFFNTSTNFILKLFRIGVVHEQEPVHTDDELMFLMEESYKHGMIDNMEYSYVENIFDFSDKKAKEIMIPRTDMVCIDVAATVEEMQEIFLTEQMTRYPVYEENKDNIIGFINIKDLYYHNIVGKTIEIRSIMRKVLYIPETTTLNNLIKKMQAERIQLAVLIDEYGGTSGLVTTEDILEEIVGSIQDEYDDESESVIAQENGGYIIDGNLSVGDVNKLLNLNIETEDIDTIAGWFISMAKEMPRLNQSVKYSEYEFVISKLEKNRIIKLAVKKYT